MKRLVFLLALAMVSLAAHSRHARAAAADPLEARVTIAFSQAPAADVIGSLAAAAGVKATPEHAVER